MSNKYYWLKLLGINFIISLLKVKIKLIGWFLIVFGFLICVVVVCKGFMFFVLSCDVLVMFFFLYGLIFVLVMRNIFIECLFVVKLF